ncbi:MAG: OsmC family protein [Planctomycetota bacterium]
MAVETDITYLGDLECEAVHGPSGDRLKTDAPVDNGGRGAAFSPTDLVAAALGTCIVTIMDKVAVRHGWDLRGTRVHVVKEMITGPARRIGALRVTVTLPKTRAWAADDLARLRNAAETCPVKGSLDAQVQVPLEFLMAD